LRVKGVRQVIQQATELLDMGARPFFEERNRIPEAAFGPCIFALCLVGGPLVVMPLPSNIMISDDHGDNTPGPSPFVERAVNLAARLTSSGQAGGVAWGQSHPTRAVVVQTSEPLPTEDH